MNFISSATWCPDLHILPVSASPDIYPGWRLMGKKKSRYRSHAAGSVSVCEPDVSQPQHRHHDSQQRYCAVHSRWDAQRPNGQPVIRMNYTRTIQMGLLPLFLAPTSPNLQRLLGPYVCDASSSKQPTNATVFWPVIKQWYTGQALCSRHRRWPDCPRWRRLKPQPLALGLGRQQNHHHARDGDSHYYTIRARATEPAGCLQCHRSRCQ